MKAAGLSRRAKGWSALRNLAVVALPMVAMCDSRDLGGVVDSKNLGRRTMILYDRYPGGLGYCEKGFQQIERAAGAFASEMVAECQCDDGCPSCVGLPNLRPAIHSDPDLTRGYPMPNKAAALELLSLLCARRQERACAGSIGNTPHVDRRTQSAAGTTQPRAVLDRCRRRIGPTRLPTSPLPASLLPTSLLPKRPTPICRWPTLAPGEIRDNASGQHYAIRQPLTELDGAFAARLAAAAEHMRCSRADRQELHPELAALVARFPAGTLFLDLETCGFAGSPIFLVGLLHAHCIGPVRDGQQGIVLEQLLARDYTEECSVLETLWRRAAENRRAGDVQRQELRLADGPRPQHVSSARCFTA